MKIFDDSMVVIILMMLVVFIAAGFGMYIERQQRLECMKLNAARPADDIAKLCGKV